MNIIARFVILALMLLSQPSVASISPAVIDAARVGNLEVVKQSISSGANVNDTDSNGYSLLILATYHGQYSVARYLLAQGADPGLLDNHGRSALMGAAFKNDIGAARILLGNPRTDVNQQNPVGQTAAMYAALFGHKDFLTFLLSHGADLALNDKKGNTAASLAAAQGNQSLADWISTRSVR
ncbi:ankyrin repeat domain-containing protein [Dryocola clanedunensis]|uniref:ankyrin repeat domain-containing protein n=1 Tax=Cedecea sulfonylureivorans TaxID=3051154 RepID=UPI00192783E2|nr:ankyrin repeat domain-containing protein [Cedecea sulfonylureivorans]